MLPFLYRGDNHAAARDVEQRIYDNKGDVGGWITIRIKQNSLLRKRGTEDPSKRVMLQAVKRLRPLPSSSAASCCSTSSPPGLPKACFRFFKQPGFPFDVELTLPDTVLLYKRLLKEFLLLVLPAFAIPVVWSSRLPVADRF